MASARRIIVDSDEPLGIVISRGVRDDTPPTVWAYVWAPPSPATSAANTATPRETAGA